MTNSVMESLIKKNSENIVSYKIGQVIKGTILDTTVSRILLELPGGVTGIITKKEIGSYSPSKESVFSVGETLESTVIDPENEQGLVLLSLKRASQDMVWAELNTLLEEKRSIKIKIEEANKGGLMARYKGIKAFLPVSQLMPINYPRVDGANSSVILSKLQGHIGKEFIVRVINVDRAEDKLIISEKSAHSDQSKTTIKDIKKDDIVEGVVSGVVKFGIFVTFGGVEGLVHLSELDWGLVTDPSKKYSLGDRVEVMVIGVDGEKLSLSIKRLKEDPWKKKVEKFAKGQKVSGPILRWNIGGVFINLEKDVQGCFDLKEFDVENPNDLKIKAKEILEGEIINIDLDAHRIELKIVK